MELHLSRTECLRQVRSVMGQQTDETIASAISEQQIVALNHAAAEVALECGWVNTQARTTVDLGAEQSVLNYPESAGPGSVRRMAVYDGDRYYHIEMRIIPVEGDTDQEEIAGGATFDGVQGRPRYAEQREQIHLSPPSDKAYKIRIEYQRPVTFAAAGSVSIVDAQLIIFKTVYNLAVIEHDMEIAAAYSEKYDKRRRLLQAWQSAGSRTPMDPNADLGEDEDFPLDPPNWDRSPTVR